MIAAAERAMAIWGDYKAGEIKKIFVPRELGRCGMFAQYRGPIPADQLCSVNSILSYEGRGGIR